ncbi:MAG TPA: hypothetical protein VM936_22135 [Pyrinomonadaceae bacterium]|jgi:hypothetical protein|nr:hypothetical protein [Pyrinomonadaceae bacterium]
MEELIKQVTERTGISEQQARGAVETVLGFLKNRLPEPLSGQLDGLVGGAAGAAGGIAGAAGDVLGGLGGMFGGKKD